MKSALIGYGKFGKILFDKFKPDIICDRNNTQAPVPIYKDYKKVLNKVDWVIIATPVKTHYDIVKSCLLAGKNVFVEKPLCIKSENAKELIQIAKKKKVKLYVDDVFLHRTGYKQLKQIKHIKEIKFSWKKYGTFDDSILNALFYHDMCMLNDLFKGRIKDIKYIQGDNKLRLTFMMGKRKIECNYNRLSKHREKKVEVNGKKIIFRNEDVLAKMVPLILSKKVDFKKNNTNALKTVENLEQIRKTMFRVAIVGGGIFGCTIAWFLGKEGFFVDLFEARKDIFMGASGTNQNRLHRGYYYPRSEETIMACMQGEKEFRDVYSDAVIDSPHKHYYGIAKEESFLNAKQCFKVWDKYNLKHKEVKLSLLNHDNFDKCVKVEEAIIDPTKLKNICLKQMKKYNVNIQLNKQVTMNQLEDYDLVVVATYAFNNCFLKKKNQKNYQFEIIEKIVLRLPKEFKNKSIVVQDGPFTCIDPFGRTNYTLMGNVTHAIHHSNIGKFPKIPLKFKTLINNGIIKNPKITKVKKFLDAAEKFFPNIQQAKHIGSMYTIRTVLPFREHDDARPTIVEKIDGVIMVFSGKIPTCVDSANQILKIAKDISTK